VAQKSKHYQESLNRIKNRQ